MQIIRSVFAAFAVVLMLFSTADARVTKIFAVGSSVSDSPSMRVVSKDAGSTKLVDRFRESWLYTIDPESGQADAIGPTGFYSCMGLEAHPATYELYAVCNEPFDFNPFQEPTDTRFVSDGQVLVMLDKATGQGTYIGALGGNIGLPARGPFVSDISFHPDGTLYAHVNALIDIAGRTADASTRLEDEIVENTLGTINLQNGYFSPIGPTNEWDDYSAIAFLNGQQLFQHANFDDIGDNRTHFNSLNPGTGGSSFVRQLEYPLDAADNFNLILSKDADHASDKFYGIMFSRDTNGGPDPEAFEKTNNIEADGNYLVRLNRSDESPEVVGFVKDETEAFLGIAVMGEPRMVPTMSEYGLIFTAVILLGAAVLFLRRRRTKAEI